MGRRGCIPLVFVAVLSLLANQIALSLVHFTFTQYTGSNASVALPASANPNIDGSPLVTGDEVAVFNSTGVCVGATVWQGKNTSITVWGKSTSPPLPGMQVGEQMMYRVWRRETNFEYSSGSVTYSWGDGLFEVNGIYVVSSLTANYKPLRITPALFLEGPYLSSSGLMSKALNTAGYLSSHFPGMRIPSEAVDSISIEIRDSLVAAKSTRRISVPAWLLADGTVRGFTDTTTHYVELETGSGTYYVVVHHRNHLSIMSSVPLAMSYINSVYDFTASATRAYGTGSMKELATGVFGMIAGDNDASGVVDALDRTVIWNDRNQAGYLSSDLDLSGVVDALDRTIVWNKRNQLTQVP